MPTLSSPRRPAGAVVFLLPGYIHRLPVGGYKMVFLYANALAARGWDVTVVYDAGMMRSTLRHRVRQLLTYVRYRCQPSYRECRWFALDGRVKTRLVWSFGRLPLRPDAAYVATAIQTAFALQQLPVPEKHKFYFVQGYENWHYSDAEVRQSYRFPLQKVVISRWLQSKVEEAGATAVRIPNGFRDGEFYLRVSPQNRPAASVLMLYQPNEVKGCRYGIELLERLHAKRPELKATLFGVVGRPEGLPAWVAYECNPSRERLCELYNQAAIFMATSLAEGWGLTVGEAMMCGCAVACTDIEGYREMALEGETALLSPPRDVEAMQANVERLMADADLRLSLSRRAMSHMRQFTIEASTDKWEALLAPALVPTDDAAPARADNAPA